MLALRVPCDARMSQRDVNSLRSDSTSRNPRLILCFSASLNGRLEIKIKDEGQETKDQRDINYLSSFRHASSQNPFFLLILDTGIRRYDGRNLGCL